jgi:hypothetical protein
VSLIPLGPQAKIGLGPKLAFTAFMVVYLPYYLVNYGPTNFVYICDTSLLLAFAAIWTERSLLASMPACGVLLVQFGWCLDFGVGFFGIHIGMADYMFDPHLSLFGRGLSLFHGWLPWVLLWMVYRLGYHQRAVWVWTPLAYMLLCVSYFVLPAPPPPANDPNVPANVNLVFGLSSTRPQTWMPEIEWFWLIVVILTVIFIATHFALKRWLPPASVQIR